MFKGVIDVTGEVLGVAKAHMWGFEEILEVRPRLHHSNVVGYCGCSTEKGERVLVFEYMPNGSLADWLFGEYSERACSLSEAPETHVEVRCMK